MSREVVHRTVTAIRAVQLYGLSHDTSIDEARSLTSAVNGQLCTHERVTLELDGGRAYVSGEEVRPGDGLVGAEIEVLHEIFSERLAAGIVFEELLDPDDLRSWIGFFARPVVGETGARRLHRDLSALESLGVRLILERTTEPKARATSSARDCHARMVGAFEGALDRVGGGEDLDWERVDETIDELVRSTLERPDVALRIVTGPRVQGPYSAVHATNTALLSILIGRMLELESDQCRELASCAMFADVGFAILPEIAHRLMSPSEKEELRAYMVAAVHPMLRRERLDDRSRRRLIVAYEHHRSYLHPGSGRRADVHPYSRIVAVADAFDAMIADRPWRSALSRPAAMACLERDRSWRFDPLVVTTLGTLLRGSV
jgi:hypothetical protein